MIELPRNDPRGVDDVLLGSDTRLRTLDVEHTSLFLLFLAATVPALEGLAGAVEGLVRVDEGRSLAAMDLARCAGLLEAGLGRLAPRVVLLIAALERAVEPGPFNGVLVKDFSLSRGALVAVLATTGSFFTTLGVGAGCTS